MFTECSFWLGKLAWAMWKGVCVPPGFLSKVCEDSGISDRDTPKLQRFTSRECRKPTSPGKSLFYELELGVLESTHNSV